MFLALIAIVFTLLLVVGMHELGHAFASSLAKVRITKISIGFGRTLLSWRSKRGCEWVWALWPLGGYVQLLNTRIAPVSPDKWPFCFDKKPIWVRIGIVLAGSLSNLLLAWFAFFFVFFVGLIVQLPIVQSIEPNSIAAKALMRPRDQFISIGSQAVDSYREVGMRFIEFWGSNNLKVRVKGTNGELRILDFNLSQEQLSADHSFFWKSIGIVPDVHAERVKVCCTSIGEAFNKTNATIGELIRFLLVILKQLVLGLIPFSVLLGPIGLFSVSFISLKQGLIVFIFFIATLSTAVAFINLFPIPGLDGGSIVYALIEKVRGKPISVALELLIHRLVFIVFCLLFVQLILNDVQRIGLI